MLPAYDLNDQASHGRKKRKLTTGNSKFEVNFNHLMNLQKSCVVSKLLLVADFWILIGGVVGIAAIVTIACFVLLRKNTKGSPQGNEGTPFEQLW